jgi:hypothetical protein
MIPYSSMGTYAELSIAEVGEHERRTKAKARRRSEESERGSIVAGTS